ncbi:polysaccharide export outer membrane protein [Bacteroidia bacterium]|nr:polysaccharide export outer membrane protein [Bacteroidia bacterium]GHV70968.1 polysaccharide export outer membrane protein [Bacteroidia bacterium]
MKFNNWILSFFVLLIIVSSCTPYRKVQYLQIEEDMGSEYQLVSHYKESVIRFQPEDVLSITVNILGEPILASDFNLPFVPSATNENSTEDYVNMGVGRQTYLVDKEGNIDFPTLGLIQVTGRTQSELEKYIKSVIISDYLKSKDYSNVPCVVTVRLLNFGILIAGEVNRPGRIAISRDHVNVLEALTLAGDMTIYGKRDDVRIYRETPDGNIKAIHLDLTKETILSSPDFYLHQNDMIFVAPMRARAISADMPQLSTIVTLGSFLMTLITFAIYSMPK